MDLNPDLDLDLDLYLKRDSLQWTPSSKEINKEIAQGQDTVQRPRPWESEYVNQNWGGIGRQNYFLEGGGWAIIILALYQIGFGQLNN